MIYDLDVVFREDLRYGSSVWVARRTMFSPESRWARDSSVIPAGPKVRTPASRPRLGAVNPRS